MDQSYKILTALRLAINPDELLNYFELHERAIATTPDGEQHIFTFTELRAPAKNISPYFENKEKQPSDTPGQSPRAPRSGRSKRARTPIVSKKVAKLSKSKQNK